MSFSLHSAGLFIYSFEQSKMIKKRKMVVQEQEKRHYFNLGKPAQSVKILYNGIELANTTNPLLLKEVGKQVYDQVYYIPREDTNMLKLVKNEKDSVCPIKGTATYYDLKNDNKVAEDIAWSYENPLPRAKRIKNYIAFYSDKVSFVLEPYNQV